MAFTHKLLLSWQDQNTRTLREIVSASAGSQISVSEEVVTGEPDTEITFACDVSAIKMIYINSSQDVTLETNSGAGSADVLNLKADEPYIWWSTSLFANLLTEDVTALFITNASGETAKIEIEVLFDPTP